MARKPTSKAEDLRVAYVPLASLKPYPRNARKHNQRQIRLLAESIKEFGWTLPVLIDAENMILAGHGRVEAAKLLGMEAVPSLRIERLNESQKRALSDVNACGTDFRFSIRRISGSSQPSRSEDEQEIRNQQSLG